MSDKTEFQEVLERIDKLLRELDDKLKQADSAYRRGMQLLDSAEEWLGEGAVRGLKQTITKANGQLQNTGGHLKSSVTSVRVHAGPVMTMMDYDDAWLEIRNLANAVAAKLERPQDRLDRFWEGPAATKYFSVVDPQLVAARRLAALAEKAATTLQDMAAQGIAFYIAIAVALGVAIGGLITAIAGFLSVVGAPVGVAGAVVVAGAAIAFTGASYNFALQQDKLGTSILGEATNVLGFSPGPAWPTAVALSTDVTAADGDEADWRARTP